MTIQMIQYIVFAVVLIELGLAVYFDLWKAKFPNQLFLAYLPLNLALAFLLRGVAVIHVVGLTALVALAFLIPIYLVRILGGGDVKLIFAISPVLLMDEFMGFLLMSFVWAGVFGLVTTLFGGNLRALLVNTVFVGARKTVPQEGTPFTVGILLGWCSYKTFLLFGVF